MKRASRRIELRNVANCNVRYPNEARLRASVAILSPVKQVTIKDRWYKRWM